MVFKSLIINIRYTIYYIVPTHLHNNIIYDVMHYINSLKIV